MVCLRIPAVYGKFLVMMWATAMFHKAEVRIFVDYQIQ